MLIAEQIKYHIKSLVPKRHRKPEKLREEFLETDFYNDLNAIEKVHRPLWRSLYKAALQWRIVFLFGLSIENWIKETNPCS